MLKSIALLWILVAVSSPCDKGHFWQVTDIHYDANYSVPTSHELSKCREGRGRFGEYPCDSPWTLVTSALSWMQKIQPDPDFILWTGDSIPHEKDAELNTQKVFNLIKNVTEELVTRFPNTPIFPSIGNHDAWPSNQVPPVAGDDYYQSLLTVSGWDNMLDLNTSQQFLQGGFYASSYGKLTLLAMNTILWYSEDALTNSTDPLGQFLWLNTRLEEARRDGRKVILHGHVPPGTLARAPLPWYRPAANTAMARLLDEYGDVVTAAIFGHEHTDSFRVLIAHDKNSEPRVPVYMSPAITPWESTVPGLGSVNPSVRRYQYCRDTGLIMDYDQYFLNLTLANQQLEATWELEYSLTKAYGVQDGSAESLRNIVQKLGTDRGSFDMYFRYNSVSQDLTTVCEGKCTVRHLCAMLYTDYNKYNKCVEEGDKRIKGEWFPLDSLHAWWWANDDGSSNQETSGKSVKKETDGLSGTAVSVIGVIAGLCGLAIVIGIIWLATNGLDRAEPEMRYSLLRHDHGDQA